MGFSSILQKLLLLFLFAFLFFAAFSQTEATHHQSLKKQSVSSRSRRLLEFDSEVKPTKKKTNQTKLIKPTTNSTKTLTTSQPKKLNSTSISLPKKLNSTSNSFKSNSNSTKKSIDLSKESKPTSPKNKTKTPITKQPPPSTQTLPKPQIKPKQSKTQKPITPNWMDFDLDGEFITDIKDLPFKFHKNLIPDLERISTTSKAYIFQANKEITNGFKPLVGNKYASTIASITSSIFIIAPLLLVSLIFNRIKAYFSLQKLLIFIQIYLAIYFLILCLASLVSGLEPLRFFYATSQSSYVCLQVLQTLGYVLYLLMLLMYLVLVFASSEVGVGLRMLGLIQTIVGFAVGLHYYVSVFHRAVLHQAPKTNWKVHGIYAMSFFVICAFAGAERRKKAYLEDGGDEGKKS